MNKRIEPKIRELTSKYEARIPTLAAPTILPKLAPALIIPKSLLLISLFKISASKLHAVLNTQRLKILTHT